jgi:glycosyltransferase involved in cell wall biosynthesis
MNIPSFHQNDLYNELAKNYDKFEVIYAHAQDHNRIRQGWSFGNIQQYKFKTIGMDLSNMALISYVFKHRKATHVVSGIWAEKSFLFVIILLNLFRVNFLIYSEAPIPTKKKSFSKKIILNFIVRPLAKILIIRASGFLAVSDFAVEYFKSLGAKIDKIYRYGYFRTVNVNKKLNSDSSIISLIFVGQLIERKGILLLLEAIRVIAETKHNFHLNVIGTGKLASILKEFIDKHQLQNRITLLGVIQSENIVNYIGKADLLILPSIFDGWGMVVNEAMQSRVPVLISDQCGAKELINHRKNGLIFNGNNLSSLTENIDYFLQLSLAERNLMKDYAGKMGEKISVPIVCEYLGFCLNHCLKPQHLKPIAPWLNE